MSARRRLSVLAAIAAASVVVVAACQNGSDNRAGDATGDRSAAATTASEARRGPDPDRVYRVGRVELDLVDAGRPTKAVGEFAGSDERRLTTLVFYPADGDGPPDGDVPEPVDDAEPARGDGPYPLVVFSHGFSAQAVTYKQFLLPEIASEGYVVAAATYPLSSGQAPGAGPDLLDVRNQPGDVSFVIDELLTRGRAEGDPLDGLIDEEQIGAAGHSLGAITTLLLGFHGCCLDERIDAAVSLAGRLALAPREGDWFPQGADTPLLFVHGDEDALVSYPSGRDAFERAAPPKYLVTLLGGDHASPFLFGNGKWSGIVRDSVIAFLDAYLEERRTALDRLATVADVPGVATFERVRP